MLKTINNLRMSGNNNSSETIFVSRRNRLKKPEAGEEKITINPTNRQIQLKGPVTQYEQSSFFGRLHFMYLTSLQNFVNSLSRPIRLSDLTSFDKLLKLADKPRRRTFNSTDLIGSSFYNLIIEEHKRSIVLQIFYAFLVFSSQVALALLLKYLAVEYQNQGEKKMIYWYLGFLLLALLVSCYATSQYFMIGYRMTTRMKYRIIDSINQKILLISTQRISRIHKQEYAKIASNHCTYTEPVVYWGMGIVAPFFLVIHTVVLWWFFSYYSLIGIGTLLLCWPMIAYEEGNESAKIPTKEDAAEKRMGLINELIQKMRFIKMNGFLELMLQKIESARQSEDSAFRNSQIFQWSVASITTLLAIAPSFLMFLVYYVLGNPLTLDNVFMAILLLLYTKTAIFHSIKLSIASRRKFVRLCSDCEHIFRISEYEGPTESMKKLPTDPSNSVEFADFSGSWKESGARRDNVFNDLNLSIKKGKLTMLLGQSKSGKSSLLASILQELPYTRGTLRIDGRIAIADQDPLLIAGAIRENIVFGPQIDEERYISLVEDIGLVKDLNLLEDSDRTVVGENGKTVSRSVRAKIALARVVYSETDVVLLDNPFNGLDKQTARKLFNDIILGPLKGKTIIMVTNDLDFIPFADEIIVLEKGEVIAKGDYGVLRSEISQLTGIQKQQFISSPVPQQEPKEEFIPTEGSVTKDISASLDLICTTHIKTYFRNEPSLFLKIFCFLLTFTLQASVVIYLFSIGYLIQRDQFDVLHYIIIGGWILALIFVGMLRGVTFARIIARIATRFHNLVLQRVSRAVASYFENILEGEVQRGFSEDINTLETVFPWPLYKFLDCSMYLFLAIIALCVADLVLIVYCLLLGFVVFMVIHSFFKIVFVARSVEIQTQELLERSFMANFKGMATLRAYGYQNIATAKFEKRLSENKSCVLASRIYGQASAFWLEFGFVFINIGAIAYLFLYTTLPAYLLLFAVLLILQLCNITQQILRQVPEMLVQVGSIQHIEKLLDCPGEREYRLISDAQLPVEWPKRGEIDFQDVSVKYHEHLPLSLKDVSFKVRPGEKVAIVGAPGQGKSTIIQALFRMIEIDIEAQALGKILVDGRDISKIGLERLRKSFSLIDQTPLLISGTLRENIDPLHVHTDDKVWEALWAASMDSEIKALPFLLQEQVSDETTHFSADQKKLINMARVLLQNPAIVLIDEATSLIRDARLIVRQETDAKIQSTLLKRFKYSTFLNITHNMLSVANYDRVLVVKNGEIVEDNHPYTLLVKEPGDQEITNPNGEFANLVEQCEEKSEIFELAKNSYYRVKSPKAVRWN